ncbi:39S ribosomal protein L35 [Blattella germanica]|nr:39S ribosomal protein L35 [Blattella germanica]
MLRLVVGAARCIGSRSLNSTITSTIAAQMNRCSILQTQSQLMHSFPLNPIIYTKLSNQPLLSCFTLQPRIQNLLQPQVRTVTKFSIRKGKRKSVKAVKKRFFRLAWGGWIRTHAGRFKHLWKKPEKLKKKYRKHVFCNAAQCTLLDKMVTSFWKRRKYYVDDPYEPYHSREEFQFTRRKPLPVPPK